MGKKIAVLILNYNTYEKTKNCIISCQKQKGETFDLYVIDNFSSDDSLNKLKKEFVNGVEFIENRENYGYAKGNNIAVAYALNKGYKYSFLLNSDTTLNGDLLIDNLFKIISEKENCAIIAPNIYNVTKEGLQLNKNDSGYLKLLRAFRILGKNKQYNDKLVETSEAHGAALFVNNHIFLELGGFPEHYFMYGEESSLCKKTVINGYKILWEKDENNYVLHHHDETESKDEWREFLKGRNMLLSYYEQRKIAPVRWYLIIFFLVLKVYLKNDRPRINGFKEARKLVKSKSSKEQMFNNAVLMKEKLEI